MMGLLNGGLSGFTIGHSDIGAYTTIQQFPKFLNRFNL